MLTLRRLDPTGADREALIAFLTGHEFPFHMRPRLTRAQVEQDIDDGAYRDDENDSYWLHHQDHGHIGIVRLEDLEDPSPVFDLRLATEHRGHGLGEASLRAITRHVFETLPNVTRFEGQTREDNIGMRTLFLRCGWLKEAHYRESWPVAGGAPLASVAYAILRRDWETGTVTHFEWEDLTG